MLTLRRTYVEEIEGKDILMVDSIRITGKSANDGYVDLARCGAHSIALAALIDVDVVRAQREQPMCKVITIGKVSQHIRSLQSILGLEDMSATPLIVQEASFWRRPY